MLDPDGYDYRQAATLLSPKAVRNSTPEFHILLLVIHPLFSVGVFFFFNIFIGV